MSEFNKMDKKSNNNIDHYYFTHTKSFKQTLYVSNNSIHDTFDFAYRMASELHREYRTGGNHIRQPNEIFVNTFTGKLAEFALFEYFKKYDIVTSAPDLDIYPRNIWDEDDFTLISNTNKKYKINVKSTKHFGHLLLLEAGDYNSKGIYTPSETQSDFYVFVRLQFDLERKIKSIKSLYDEKLMEKRKLQLLINETIEDIKLDDSDKTNTKIYYDIPGYITHDDLIYIINNDFLIRQDDFLGRKTSMDADNYYIQSGDFRNPIDLKFLN